MQRSALCRSLRELSNAYFLAKFCFDTAENEPSKVCRITRQSGQVHLAGVPGPGPPRAGCLASALAATLASQRRVGDVGCDVGNAGQPEHVRWHGYLGPGAPQAVKIFRFLKKFHRPIPLRQNQRSFQEAFVGLLSECSITFR